MAKNPSKAYRADIAGYGLHRIDGIVREVNAAGVMIDIKERGRRTQRPTLIPMQDIVCHTAEGAGFVVATANYALEPIAGKVIEESADAVVLEDADGTQIVFPLGGKMTAQFVSLADDDRALNRGAVETKVARLAERESGTGGRKKGAKAEKSGGKSKRSPTAKAGKRRAA